MENNISDLRQQEKLSSAFTLSDMEIFIFPELFYPLVMANIMSPIIWSWRDDPWFSDISERGFISKMNRIKQYIIDNYVFNLDLETWGLTTQESEINRFSPFFDVEILRQSNALFGYEGDKYYFDIDIRKHFGLDKYDSTIIPYWKTETIEAMNAFNHKKGFYTGAGECVSLSALYAAAIFIVGRVPLEKIFLIATPLHSQNFVNEQDGLITNNRRIVTRNMWFNGTSLSSKARRALENERVTIVSHISGYIHTIYNEATIDRAAYIDFKESLSNFLTTSLSPDIFISFLRSSAGYRKLFQFRVSASGKDRYIPVEKIFEYEHSSRYNLTLESRKKLIGDIDGDEFSLSPLSSRYLLNDLEDAMHGTKTSSRDSIYRLFINAGFDSSILRETNLLDDIDSFISTVPHLPATDRNFIPAPSPEIGTELEREQIIDLITLLSPENEMSMLSLYVYRKMDVIEWEPFIKAAIERNNVSFSDLAAEDQNSLYHRINGLDNISIYDGDRFAMPDEVWNFGRGDGIEKALLMASVLVHKNPGERITVEISGSDVKLFVASAIFGFISEKGFNRIIRIEGKTYTVDKLNVI